MVTRLKRTLSAASALLVAAACLLMLFLRIPRTMSAATVTCRWESGVRVEPYAEALGAFAGIGDGEILLERDGEQGVVATGGEFARVHATLETGSLLELVTLDTSSLAPIERAALYLCYHDALYYTEGAFRFDGSKVLPSDMVAAKRVILLGGSLPSHYLRDTGAAFFALRADAEIFAKDFAGSAVREWQAEAPYAAEGDALFLDTAGGRRFVAALPLTEELCVADCDFADAGALCAAQSLTRLNLPFVGNAKARHTGFDGSLAWLFMTEGEASMPATLASLKVRGGVVDAFAFRNTCIEELDLCGVEADNISPQAFLGMPRLRMLHVPCGNAVLEGNFSVRTAPCGCLVYEWT